MATQVSKSTDLALANGDEVTVRPLVIGRLRAFMEAWEKFGEAKDDNDGFTVFVNCAGIALEDSFKDDFPEPRANAAERKKGEFLNPGYKSYLENALDLDTIYLVLDVAGGIKLNDPKLMENLAAAQLGQSST